MTLERNEAFLRLAIANGEIAVLTELSQKSKGEDTVQIPQTDMLILALAKLLAAADPAVERALIEVQQAYAAMCLEPNAEKAAELFNAAIGVDVYSVEPKQEDAS